MNTQITSVAILINISTARERKPKGTHRRKISNLSSNLSTIYNLINKIIIIVYQYWGKSTVGYPRVYCKYTKLY